MACSSTTVYWLENKLDRHFAQRAALFVSNQFSVAKVPLSVILHISALGLYRAFINGHRLGEDMLTPG